jgi:hypothetical protein
MCCYSSRHSYGIWLSDVPRGLWCRPLRLQSGLLPLDRVVLSEAAGDAELVLWDG